MSTLRHFFCYQIGTPTSLDLLIDCNGILHISLIIQISISIIWFVILTYCIYAYILMKIKTHVIKMEVLSDTNIYIISFTRKHGTLFSTHSVVHIIKYIIKCFLFPNYQNWDGQIFLLIIDFVLYAVIYFYIIHVIRSVKQSKRYHQWWITASRLFFMSNPSFLMFERLNNGISPPPKWYQEQKSEEHIHVIVNVVTM